MFIILFLIFVIVPIIEISILIQVGDYLGLVPTIALVILTAAVGASLVRSQGLKTLLSAQQKIQQGLQPGQEMLEGVMLAVAGVLLVTPGFATDGLGLLLLLPVTRQAFANYCLTKMIKRQSANDPFGGQGFGSTQSQSEDIIEGEFVSKDQSRINQSTAQDNVQNNAQSNAQSNAQTNEQDTEQARNKHNQ
ncbi:MAG: FxsA family protein [Gammaproteobacteria bacterium]|nr:FxsA family protein [Gammaproteobacteria bacterium]